MGALYSRGTSTDGVIAFQDDAQPNQFHYLPARAQCVLGDTLENFSVSYWGINERPYLVQTSGRTLNLAGGILAGQARIDITAAQRANIVQAIKTEFGINAPSLLPLRMSNIEVQPVFATNAVKLGGDSSVSFPTSVQFGQSFVYNISSGNSLFATLVAGITTSPVPRADFGINVTGNIEFVGDPWTAEIECDLSQVYHYTRTQVSASVSWGWFRIGSASYEKIVSDLIRTQIIKIRFVEGQGTEGRQIFDVAKQIFEKINAQAVGGEGFFKFEPNPSPQGPASGGGGGGWGWSLSVNGSYSSTTFSQSIHFKETISFSGRIQVPMGAAMVLSVGCGEGTKQFFSDFQNVNDPCLNQAKLDGLQKRLGNEITQKQKKIEELFNKYVNGDIDEKKYLASIALLETITFSNQFTIQADKIGRNVLQDVGEKDITRTLLEIEDMDSAALDRYIKNILR